MIRHILGAVMLTACLLATPERGAAQTAGDAAAGSTATVVHTVKRGETLFSLAKRYGTTVEQIQAMNPVVERLGLKAGQVITIPQQKQSQDQAKEATDEGEWRRANKERVTVPAYDDNTERRLTPVRPAVVLVEPDSASADDAETPADDPGVQDNGLPAAFQTRQDEVSEMGDSVAAPVSRKATVAVIMPFQLDEPEVSRQANLVTDFYRGFLIAADTMSARLPELELLVYDTRGSSERLANYLKLENRLPGAALIIAPDNADHLRMISDFAMENGVPVLNNFVVRDTAYYTNPYMLQGNADSQTMTDKAVGRYVSMCVRDNLTPVILHAGDGRDDRRAFVEALTAALEAEGVTPRTVELPASVTEETFDQVLGPAAADDRYLVIPVSGSYNSFVKFAPALARYRNSLLAAGGELRVAGYPEWIAFRSDALDWLHDLDATIYSRFFTDANDYQVQGVEQAFEKWYGKKPAEGVPSQALLGFDTGCFVLSNIAAGRRFDREDINSWRGAQSTFDFKTEPTHAGMINDSVYIIRYLPGGYFDATVL